MRAIAVVFGAPWLGHGRRLEAILALICAYYGIVLIIYPAAAFESNATFDIAWQGYSQIAGAIFSMKAFFTGYGVLANIRHWPFSRLSRYCGASVGSFIWTAIFCKFWIIGSPLAFGSIIAQVFLFSSIGILGMTFANLPAPGAQGQIH